MLVVELLNPVRARFLSNLDKSADIVFGVAKKNRVNVIGHDHKSGATCAMVNKTPLQRLNDDFLRSLRFQKPTSLVG